MFLLKFYFSVISGAFLCTLNQTLSKVYKSNEQDKEREMEQDRDREKASLIGGSHRPASCRSPCLPFSILPSSTPSLHPCAGRELFSREEGMKRLRENYTESFSLTRQGKWRVGTSNNFWKDRVWGQRERLDKRGTGRWRDRKGQKKLSGIRGHGRWRERDWEEWIREETESLCWPHTKRRLVW